MKESEELLLELEVLEERLTALRRVLSPSIIEPAVATECNTRLYRHVGGVGVVISIQGTTNIAKNGEKISREG
jgi:hypothetical protein